MAYENLFWGMATVVAIAMFGGALCARASRLGSTLTGCAILALVNGAWVLFATLDGDFSDQAPILAVAAVLFTLVIGAAAALAMRRLLHK
jgi:lipopolysaccharide export LptBFGC system permease protein LptF